MEALAVVLRELGEFYIVIGVEDLAQLDRAFQFVSRRADPVESLHQVVNQSAEDVEFALYLDFPDAGRASGNF